MENPTTADAILDRLVHNAHRLVLQGESMRKNKLAVESEEKTGYEPPRFSGRVFSPRTQAAIAPFPMEA